MAQFLFSSQRTTCVCVTVGQYVRIAECIAEIFRSSLTWREQIRWFTVVKCYCPWIGNSIFEIISYFTVRCHHTMVANSCYNTALGFRLDAVYIYFCTLLCTSTPVHQMRSSNVSCKPEQDICGTSFNRFWFWCFSVVYVVGPIECWQLKIHKTVHLRSLGIS